MISLQKYSGWVSNKKLHELLNINITYSRQKTLKPRTAFYTIRIKPKIWGLVFKFQTTLTKRKISTFIDVKQEVSKS